MLLSPKSELLARSASRRPTLKLKGRSNAAHKSPVLTLKDSSINRIDIQGSHTHKTTLWPSRNVLISEETELLVSESTKPIRTP